MTKTNAKNAVRTAIAKAQTKPATQIAGSTPSPKEIADFMAAKAAHEAEVAAFNAAKAKSAEKVDYVALLKGKTCKVTGGKRNVGEIVKVYHVTNGKFKPSKALAEGKETIVEGVMPLFFNPKYLEVVGDMDKADFDRLTGAQQEQSNRTLYIAAYAKRETDASILLSYPLWARDVWFTKPDGDKDGMIYTTGVETAEGVKIFEVKEWRVKSQVGQLAVNELHTHQDELSALVG